MTAASEDYGSDGEPPSDAETVPGCGVASCGATFAPRLRRSEASSCEDDAFGCNNNGRLLPSLVEAADAEESVLHLGIPADWRKTKVIEVLDTQEPSACGSTSCSPATAPVSLVQTVETQEQQQQQQHQQELIILVDEPPGLCQDPPLCSHATGSIVAIQNQPGVLDTPIEVPDSEERTNIVRAQSCEALAAALSRLEELSGDTGVQLQSPGNPKIPASLEAAEEAWTMAGPSMDLWHEERTDDAFTLEFNRRRNLVRQNASKRWRFRAF